MKKIILACLLVLFSGSFLFAQQTQSTRPAQEKTKTVKKDVAHAKTHAVKTANHQNQAAATANDSHTTATATHLKKDGTPDKRYKTQDRHIKKDGTPDKRFKENKQ
ncbi:MAG: hypothetical protein M9904_16650 [Chitinophagaceae bacterium]|nr:hypothetical protein [Chitinophagaceae bacterium]